MIDGLSSIPGITINEPEAHFMHFQRYPIYLEKYQNLAEKLPIHWIFAKFC